MHKSSRKSAKVFHEKDAMLISEKVCLLKQLVGGWWEEKVDLTPCNGATPSESRIREIRTYGSMRGRRSKDLLLLYVVGAFESKCFYPYMQNYRLMSMMNQNQEQKSTVKVIAPLVGFTSDKNFLDFGDFTIRKIREDIIDSSGLEGITQGAPRYEELRELLESVEITKVSGDEEISLLENYILCLEYIDSGGVINSPKYKIDELIKAFRLYKTGNIRNYFFIFTTSSYPGTQFSRGTVRLPFPSLEYYFSYSEINDFLTFKKDLTKLIPGEWNKNNRYIGVALRHFNFAKERDNIEDKIIDYVIALEALYLGKDSGEYTYRLANRSSLMLNETFTKRKDRYKDIKNAYNWRSEIVHGAFDPAENAITDEDIEKIGDFVRISIKKFLNLNKHYKKEKIHELIDESLFGENEWDNLQKESTELLF